MIKIGVLGAGHLGKIHLKLIKEIPGLELVGFFDPDPKAAALAEKEFDTKGFPDIDSLIAACDAVDIVTPTITHFECAKKALRQFKHIFIEKPVTNTLEEAEALLRLAAEAGVKIQVGHVERFNPALLAIRERELYPMFIECHRLAQWNPRGTDVSVVLDLMIHDIDIVLSLVPSEIKRVSASGVAVISDTPDIANARIEFNNGAVANLTASRISMKNMRKARIFQKNSYLSVDFLAKKTEVFTISDQQPGEENASYKFEAGDITKYISYESLKVEPVNSILMELEEFARSITEDSSISVTLEEATAALRTAQKIVEKIKSQCLT